MSRSRGGRVPVPPTIPNHTYVEPLGSGGYSTVYLYVQEKLDRKVAVKVLRDFGDDAAALRQFRAEAKVMAELGNHTNIVPVFESDIAADGQPYLTMPYYRGPNLAMLAADGPLDVDEVISIGVGIASAVYAAHRAGIVHRDIKPANILTDEFGNRRLTDFGIAGRVVPVDDDDFGVSVPWSPPEILAGGKGSVASDIYSLGATLWHLLMGRSPFEMVGGDNRRSSLERRILAGRAPEVDRVDTPAALVTLLAEMLDPDPLRRPKSAEMVTKRLSRIGRNRQPASDTTSRAGSPVTAGPVTAGPVLAGPVVTGPRMAGPVPPRTRPVVDVPVVAPLPPESAATSVRTPLERTPRPERQVRPEPSDRARDGGRAIELWPPADPGRTRPRIVPEAPAEEPVPVGTRPGRRRTPLVWVIGAVVLVAVGIGVAIGLGGGPHGAGPAPTQSADSGDQQAGVLGEDAPPGQPTVTANRIGAGTLRFTWVYSAQEASDTYRWQTPDGKRSGTSQKPEIDLADPAGKRLCVQVKVVRADGGNASVAWSPAGCGS